MTSFAFGNPHARVHVYVEKAPPVENVFGHADDLPFIRLFKRGTSKRWAKQEEMVGERYSTFTRN